jgi:predicted O-linked N-acetylglucosamine transferase (SPINDLY family)
VPHPFHSFIVKWVGGQQSSIHEPKASAAPQVLGGQQSSIHEPKASAAPQVLGGQQSSIHEPQASAAPQVLGGQQSSIHEPQASAAPQVPAPPQVVGGQQSSIHGPKASAPPQVPAPPRVLCYFVKRRQKRRTQQMARRGNPPFRSGNQGNQSGSPVFSPVDRALQQALAHHQAGQLALAEALYRQVLQASPDHPDALRLLGLIALQVGQYASSIPLFDKAIQGRPAFAEAYADRGNALHRLQQYQAAVDSYDKAVRLKPAFAEAWSDRGVALFQLGQYQADLESCDRAIRLKPDFAAAHGNRGAALLKLQQNQAAIESCDRAIRLNPSLVEAHGNRGAALLQLQQHQAALESCNNAIALKPDYAEAYINRGGALQALGQYQAALESYDQAVLLNPALPEAWSNRGNVLYRLKNYPAALESYDKAILLKPDSEYLPGMRVHARRSICDWEGIESQCIELEAGIERNERVAHPFTMLDITSSAEVQRKAAEILVRDKFPPRTTPAFKRRPNRDKIRIGYFSADFHDHPMCSLMAEVFERHDRTRFEILAFSFGPDETDEMRLRVSAAMDRFLDVRSKSDREIARLSRELEVDIAVDLMGFTDSSRTGIFAERAAPTQVSNLGYVGSMGAPYIDYLIADHTVVPPASQQHYSEKIVNMPDCYQANDSRRVPSTTLYARAAEGLPEHGFVYCCFNNTLKITPATFDLWMRILHQVEGSVLWLLESNPWAADNLRKQAARRGVSPDRLVFAARLPLAEHLTRQTLADLFLDTLPYNAGATASHALWAGLPILTCAEEAFASRMCASLLRAIGLPELVTSTDEEYVSLAVELAVNADRHREIQERLIRNRLTAPLFDAASFTRHLESAYTAIYERNQLGLPPDHIEVARIPNPSAFLP